ncbi:MAG: NINE protein, partial [Candidatus Binatia bacterium]
FGLFGAHRFYVGKIGSGLLQLITLGGFFLWAIIDLIFIIVGSFRDKQGLRITKWMK